METRRPQALARLEELKGRWWHSLDLGEGIFTDGHKTAEVLRREFEALQLPILDGKSVLDIGAWDGYFSFEAERRGADRVVALDHFVWSLDSPAAADYREKCDEEGIAPKAYDEVPSLWRPADLPGKRPFDTAHDALESKVEPVVADFMTMDLKELGCFDVVLFLGVLYHLHDPFGALKRVAQVTRELAVIETAAVFVEVYEDRELCAFFSEDQLLGDPTNWWAPNVAALVGMCKAAGFRKVQTNLDPSTGAEHQGPRPLVRRSLSAAGAAWRSWKGTRQPLPPVLDYRTVVQAWK